MVGEISPDGNFAWNGTEWVPKEEGNTIPEVTNAPTNNVFQLGDQELAGDVGWEPVSEKTNEGGKGKLIAMSIVGMLVLSALGWLLYAFVIDSMLFPDPYSKDKFFSVVDEQPTMDEVMDGEAGDWVCTVEMEIKEEGMTIRTEFDMYVSEDSARSYGKISAGFFGSSTSDVWIDSTQIAWKTDDQETVETFRVPISGIHNSPAEELVAKSSGPIDMCFLHHYMAEGMENDPGQKFSSEKERFPDEEGVRAVKVETKMEIDGEDGEMNIAVYFDNDDNMLGTKITNSSFECLVTSELKSFSKPGWVSKADSNAPMLLDLEDDYIYGQTHYTEIVTQYNATYALENENLKIVIYSDDYDYENDTDVFTILHEVSMADADDGGAIIQTTNWNDDVVNCTIGFADEDLDNQLSPGDFVYVDCEQDVFYGYNIGISNENGIAQQVEMEVPWISPIFTIVALLGAAMLVSRRD